jgi:hypothetical protein
LTQARFVAEQRIREVGGDVENKRETFRGGDGAVGFLE